MLLPSLENMMKTIRLRKSPWTVILAFSTAVPSSVLITLMGAVPAADSQVLPKLQEREFHEHDDWWSIDIKYPEITGADFFNLAIHRNLKLIVDGFKKGLPGPASKDSPGAYLTGTYRAYVLKDGVVSLLVEYDTYYPGAAHPGGELASINYDAKEHRLLALSDLFRPRSPFVSLLSEMAIQSLNENEYADTNAVRRGAGPVERNFKVFTLTDTELVLHFQTYQVSAGAAGPQQLVIPLTRLKPLLRQRFCSEP